MNNALFMTGIAVFFHTWGGAMLGTALSKLTANQFDRPVLQSLIGGTLMAFIPLLVTGPTWVMLNQPVILAIEMLILLLAIGIPMFVPIKYREMIFGFKTYWVWLGVGLVLAGIYLVFLPKEMAVCIGLSTLFASAWFLWQGTKMLRKP